MNKDQYVEYQKSVRGQTLVCEVISAEYANDPAQGMGILLVLNDENDKVHVRFIEKDLWGRIGPNQNPAKELKKIVDIFNSYQKKPNGKPKKINVVM